ncbi:MAG: hypothetical protein II702_06935 [Clostridia bacterium]|jgi:hypothetical protein|nr:hypothetical protein [Clostridia bacterium]MBQ4244631.1 hypothetical protein [Clostridia bacterium]
MKKALLFLCAALVIFSVFSTVCFAAPSPEAPTYTTVTTTESSDIGFGAGVIVKPGAQAPGNAGGESYNSPGYNSPAGGNIARPTRDAGGSQGNNGNVTSDRSPTSPRTSAPLNFGAVITSVIILCLVASVALFARKKLSKQN